MYCVICVVFPLPVSPTTIRIWFSVIALINSSYNNLWEDRLLFFTLFRINCSVYSVDRLLNKSFKHQRKCRTNLKFIYRKWLPLIQDWHTSFLPVGSLRSSNNTFLPLRHILEGVGFGILTSVLTLYKQILLLSINILKKITNPQAYKGSQDCKFTIHCTVYTL